MTSSEFHSLPLSEKQRLIEMMRVDDWLMYLIVRRSMDAALARLATFTSDTRARGRL